jgi:adenine-specific DNA-methyltransferase
LLQKGVLRESADAYSMDSLQNHLHQGDCLRFINERIETLRNSFRVIYIDPPFFSGTRYSVKSRYGGSAAAAETVSEVPTFSDKWQGLDEYIEFMHPRLEAMHELLAKNGSLWVHLDWHVSHYVKTLLDEIFDYNNFINEIVWKRTNSPKVQSRGLGAQHDVILLYAKDSQTFSLNPIYRKHDEKSRRPYSYEDERGKFRLIEIEAQGIQRTKNRKQFDWHGRIAPYLYRRETLDKWWEDGLIYRSKNGRYTKKQYLSDTAGVPVSDLWLDLPPVQGSSLEYTGFLTQKPEALLRRIIQAASDEGDLIGDFFAGSGTTAIASLQLNRRWLLCEEVASTLEIIKKRLQEVDGSVKFSFSSF